MSGKKKNKIGLALGSGAYRGFAHLGVIDVLKKNDVPISYVSGTSIGALVAAYYALHQEVYSLEKIFLESKKNFFKLANLGWRSGLVSNSKYEKFIEHLLGKKTFSQTKIPLRILATDLANGKSYIFSKGSLANAVQASSSVPIIFEPAQFEKHCFVDGALSSPVAVEQLINLGADKIIAVNLYHKNEFVDKKFSLAKVAMRSARIALYNLALHSVKDASVVINPDTSDLLNHALYKKYFTKELAQQMIEIGREDTEKKIKEIKSWL
jgi:NTE family protein